MNKKKIGYIDVDEDLIYVLKCKTKNITFRSVRNNKHKIYDVVLHTSSLTKEEKTMYKLFNVTLINVSSVTHNELVDSINKAFNKKRKLSNKQIKYINVINNFQYLNERIEKIMNESYSHSLRVAYSIKQFADSLYLSKDRVLDVYIAALMHDIGKVFISPNILSKKVNLTPVEYQKMKMHPIKGYELLKDYLPVECLDMIRNHHKRENNVGYPEDNCPLTDWTRVLSLCDSLDAMTSDRIYSQAMPLEKGINELLSCTKEIEEGGKGKIFDSFLTKSFIEIIKNNCVV